MSDSTPPGSWPGLEPAHEAMAATPAYTAGQPARDRETLAATDRLTVAVTGMAAQLKAVHETLEAIGARQDAADKRDRRLRHVVIALVVSFALDVTLTVLVTIFAFQAHSASTQVSATVAQQQRSQVQGCQLNNQRLARESSMWPYVESLLRPPPDPTPEQVRQSQEIIAGLKAHARRAYAPRDCASAYRLK